MQSYNTNKWITGLLIVIFVVVGFVVIADDGSQDKQNRQITAGVIAPLSGESAFIGKGLKRGIDLATADADVSVETVYADNKDDAKGAVSAYNKLTTSHNPDVVVSSGNQVSALVPLAKEDNQPLLATVSSASGVPAQGENIFRYFTNADTDAPVMAEYATRELEQEKFGVLFLNDQFGADYKRVFANVVAENGGEVVGVESFNYGNFDYRSQLTKLRSQDPDAIYLIGLGHQLVPAVKQAKKLGVDAQILSMGTIATKEQIEKIGAQANGIDVTAFCTDKLSESYLRKFKEMYNQEPGFYSEIGHDIAKMVIKSAQDKGFTKKGLDLVCSK
jgi:branched-chain amino acid transport system substrate-binding protein